MMTRSESLWGDRPIMDVGEIIRALMVRDIQDGADVLCPSLTRTMGVDGYVSIEVSPAKARDTQATIEEVRNLWRLVGRRESDGEDPGDERRASRRSNRAIAKASTSM